MRHVTKPISTGIHAIIALTITLSLFATGSTAAQNTAAQTVLIASDSATESDWSKLSAAQQQALAPLAADWSRMDATHKKKWLVIGNKFPSMKPEERSRIQNRMREWVKLSPQQRHMARENYWRAKKINPSQKSAHWQAYQQLPEEQKKSLAAAASKKRVTGLSKVHKGNNALPVTPQKTPIQPDQTGNTDSSILAPSAAPLDTK